MPRLSEAEYDALEDEITRNPPGVDPAKSRRPARDKQAILDSLAGITAENPVSLEEARKGRLHCYQK